MEAGNHEVRAAWGFLGIRLPLAGDEAWAESQKTVLQALGMLDPEGKPTARYALIEEMDLARLTQEAWQKERSRMEKTCLGCHPAVFVSRHFEDGDRMVMEGDLLLAEAIRIVAGLYKDNILESPWNYPYSFPDLLAVHDARTQIEERLYLMFLRHRMNAFQGAFHGNPDYAFQRGLSAMKQELAGIRAMDEELRRSSQ